MGNKANALDHEALLLKKIASQESSFDPDAGMLRLPFSSPGYHTKLTKETHPTVHPTYPSLAYALGLLNTGISAYEERASAIIERVIALQDRDPGNDTYGIWPWFYEEPLVRMAPPDWNWADFCGKELVLAALRHGGRLPDELNERIREAASCACEAIIKRDVGPHYTNIAILGALVTLIAGELYGRKEFAEYGLQRLEKLKRHTEELGTFQEFNSPTYTMVAIVELSKIRAFSVQPRAKEIASDLLDAAWRMIAQHFHPATGQWAGPHSRSYSTLLTKPVKSFLQAASGNRLLLLAEDELEYSAEWYGIGCECPEPYLDMFVRPEERVVETTYYRNAETGYVKRAVTQIAPRYAVGTFSEEIMWNQTRGMVAYFANGNEPVYLQMRCLHDGYDYSSAVLSASAERDFWLLGARFVTNGGDTHPNLDRIDGSIRAADLRFRFEFGGALDGVGFETSGRIAHATVDGLKLRFEILYAAFGEKDASIRHAATAGEDVSAGRDAKDRKVASAWRDAKDGQDAVGGGDVSDGKDAAARVNPEKSRERKDWRWEIVREGGTCGLDLVIHAGERRTIDFRALGKAAFLFSFAIGGKAERPPTVMVTEEGNGSRVTARRVPGETAGEASRGLSPEATLPLAPSDRLPL